MLLWQNTSCRFASEQLPSPWQLFQGRHEGEWLNSHCSAALLSRENAPSHMEDLCDTQRKTGGGKTGIYNHQLSPWKLTSSSSHVCHLQLLRLWGQHHKQSCECDNRVFMLRRSGPAPWSDLFVHVYVCVLVSRRMAVYAFL